MESKGHIVGSELKRFLYLADYKKQMVYFLCSQKSKSSCHGRETRKRKPHDFPNIGHYMQVSSTKTYKTKSKK